MDSDEATKIRHHVIPWAKQLSLVHIVTALAAGVVMTANNHLIQSKPVFLNPVEEFAAAFGLIVIYGWPLSIAITAVIIYRRGGV